MTAPDVARLGAAAGPRAGSVRALFACYGLEVVHLPPDADLPGSYWGDAEAGLRGDRLYVRDDTPLHSLLHEGCHYVCMDDARRAALDTDAGGDFIEECGVCYLGVLLAPEITDYDAAGMLADMDAWGYTFRLGSARAWFEEDAADARAWLATQGLLDDRGRIRYECRHR
ncbi:MAG: hypothetical protein HY749_12810 [Gammaproteobacteria bacterium]|nr:hypothetical protein [Gammaproteobacteria bacterium]